MYKNSKNPDTLVRNFQPWVDSNEIRSIEFFNEKVINGVKQFRIRFMLDNHSISWLYKYILNDDYDTVKKRFYSDVDYLKQIFDIESDIKVL